MKIRQVSWKNFASYGNKLHTVDFSGDEGMFYLVVGENGGGKSTLSDIMKFGVYGKLGNKRLRDIPNRFNQNTYVKVDLLASNNTNVIIERGIAPNFLKLWINGVEYDQAGKQNIEEYIADEIIGLPFYVFNNIISLSINDFKSFLTMSPHDKRMIIDKIFSLDIINSAKWLVKEELKNLRESAISYTKQLETINQTIQKSDEELLELKQKIEEREKTKLATVQEAITNYNNKLIEISENLIKIDDKLPQVIAKLKGLQESLSSNNIALRGIKEKKNLYDNQKCPTCESDLTTEYHKSVLDEMIQNEIRITENITKLNEAITSITEVRTKLSTAKSSYNNKKIEFTTILNTYKEQLATLTENVNSLESSSIQKIIDDANARKLIIIKKKDNEDKHTNFYKIVEEIFGDNGVKQLAINKIMPALNAEIRNVLVDLRMDYKVTFNRSFDATIMHLGHEVAIQQLSTGEKKKVDFAVLTAIIKMMKIKYPSLNMVFLDEIFSSIDSDGIHHILKVLSNITKDLGMNIFVVNHAPLPVEVFDYKMTVTKPNNFSSLEIQKID